VLFSHLQVVSLYDDCGAFVDIPASGRCALMYICTHVCNRQGVPGMPSPVTYGQQYASPPNSGRGTGPDVYNSAGIGVSW